MARSDGEKENAGHENAWGRRYFPIEYTAFALIEHMIKNDGSGPFSRHSLRKVRSVRGQRRDRFIRVIELLVERGLIEPQPRESNRYRVTERGKMEYLSWGRKFLEFVRSTRIKREPDERTSSSYRGVRLRDVASVMGIALENNLDELCSSIAYLLKSKQYYLR